LILLDTSVLVEALSAGGSMRRDFREAITAAERMVVPSLVLYEWRRGPRIEEELRAQEALFPSRDALPFGSEEAQMAADLYRRLPKPRGREIDIAIAACAIVSNCALWTLNVSDFEDIPGVVFRK
jgi:predicted nucleic acid-binding protein